MENQVQWTEVKKIKFHHRVKRFYYKNIFRKIYTVAIIGLVAANVFSMMKYSASAEESQGGGTGACNVSFFGNIESAVNGTYDVVEGDSTSYYIGKDSSIHVYKKPSAYGSYTCEDLEETWSCSDGNINNNTRSDGKALGYGSCSKGCIFKDHLDACGDDYECDSTYVCDNGMTKDGYKPLSDNSEYYYCEDGEWYEYDNGNKGDIVNAVYHDYENAMDAYNCRYKGEHINDGESITIYKKDTMPYGTEDGCDGYIDGKEDNPNSATLSCDEGKFNLLAYNGGFTYDTASEVEAHGYGFTSCTVEEQGGEHGAAEGQSCHIGFFGDNIESVLENGTYKYEGESNGEKSYELSHGSKINLYIEDEAFPYETCNELKETWTCNNGEIEGNRLPESGVYGYGSCAKVCTYADDEYADYDENNDYISNTSSRSKSHNSYGRYSVGKVYGESCKSESYYCEDGEWYEYDNEEKGTKVDAVYNSCSAGCLIDDGQTPIERGHFSAYRNRTVSAGSTCGEKTELDCTGPKIFIRDPWTSTNNNWYSECEVEQGQSCEIGFYGDNIESVLKKGTSEFKGESDGVKKYELSHGSEISLYVENDAFPSENCNEFKETWTCNNGEIEGNRLPEGSQVPYGYGSCARICTYADDDEEHYGNDGDWRVESSKSDFRYPDGMVYGESCNGQNYYCEDGEWYEENNGNKGAKVDNVYHSCEAKSPDCTYKGVPISNGNSITIYKQSTMPYGTEDGCEGYINGSSDNRNSATLYCSWGEFDVATDGDSYTAETEDKVLGYEFTSCTVEEPQSCTFKSVKITGDNESYIYVYKNATVPYSTENGCLGSVDGMENTNAGALYCNNGMFEFKAEDGHTFDTEAGVEEYGYGFTSCTVEEMKNCTFKGKTITGDNSYITVYKKATMPYGTEDGCFGWIGVNNQNSADLYCVDGEFRIGDSHTFDKESGVEAYGYGYASCTVAGNTTPTQPSGGGGGGGGGGGSSSKNTHNAADDKTKVEEEKTNQEEAVKEEEVEGDKEETTNKTETSKGKKFQEITTDMEQYNPSYSLEENTAYQFAKANGITTKATIQEANMDKSLTRIQMAKMLSYYAMNVLGQTPKGGTGEVSFSDVPTKLDEQYDNGVTLSYQLGIMGQNMENNMFRPYEEVSRAQFTTALSRMLYGIADGTGNIKYYEPHMAKLYNEGIITKKDPKRKEIRGYVMLMLMRSANK